MKCCDQDCDTSFCPHCGKPVGRDGVHSLLDHLRTRQRGLKNRLESVKARFGENPNEKQTKWILKAEQSVAKWEGWADFVDKALRQDQPVPEELKVPVSELKLSIRSRNCLQRRGIETLGELVKAVPDDLLECRNFGISSLNEIQTKLETRGLGLAGWKKWAST